MSGSRVWKSPAAVLNAIVIAAALAVLLVPEGLIGQRIAAHRKRVGERRLIEREWTALTTGPRLDDNSDARDVIVVFSDYQCPACRSAYFAVLPYMDQEEFGIVHRHAPSPVIRRLSEVAARAAICAEAEGSFRAMHSWLNSNTTWESEPIDWGAAGQSAIGADPEAFLECMSTEQTGLRLARDQQLANRFEVTATPTFIGRGGIHAGVPTRDDLIRILR